MKVLTKQMLLEAGIELLDEKDENGNYIVMRLGKTCRNGPIVRHQIKPALNGTYHKWSDRVQYYWLIGFNYKGANYFYPFHRLVYAWYHGETPVGYDIDHINGDSLDNDINNLRPITRKENLAKRHGHKCKYTTEKFKEAKKLNPKLR